MLTRLNGGDHFTIDTNTKSLGCTLETNIMSDVHYISIKKFLKIHE